MIYNVEAPTQSSYLSAPLPQVKFRTASLFSGSGAAPAARADADRQPGNEVLFCTFELSSFSIAGSQTRCF